MNPRLRSLFQSHDSCADDDVRHPSFKLARLPLPSATTSFVYGRDSSSPGGPMSPVSSSPHSIISIRYSHTAPAALRPMQSRSCRRRRLRATRRVLCLRVPCMPLAWPSYPIMCTLCAVCANLRPSLSVHSANLRGVSWYTPRVYLCTPSTFLLRHPVLYSAPKRHAGALRRVGAELGWVSAGR
ncbi:hypothetical protein PLICRDRAFT_500592 [Plicaturopsis crispa FD-325 SS-3]|nr:hypothetical protein PLICRDRAFT_500592 [Plicaturopsis crispa FD-325 SS-3]